MDGEIDPDRSLLALEGAGAGTGHIILSHFVGGWSMRAAIGLLVALLAAFVGSQAFLPAWWNNVWPRASTSPSAPLSVTCK